MEKEYLEMLITCYNTGVSYARVGSEWMEIARVVSVDGKTHVNGQFTAFGEDARDHIVDMLVREFPKSFESAHKITTGAVADDGNKLVRVYKVNVTLDAAKVIKK